MFVLNQMLLRASFVARIDISPPSGTDGLKLGHFQRDKVVQAVGRASGFWGRADGCLRCGARRRASVGTADVHAATHRG